MTKFLNLLLNKQGAAESKQELHVYCKHWTLQGIWSSKQIFNLKTSYTLWHIVLCTNLNLRCTQCDQSCSFAIFCHFCNKEKKISFPIISILPMFQYKITAVKLYSMLTW